MKSFERFLMENLIQEVTCLSKNLFNVFSFNAHQKRKQSLSNLNKPSSCIDQKKIMHFKEVKPSRQYAAIVLK